MREERNINTIKIYRLLLNLYPKSYLKEYKTLMEQTFKDMLRENKTSRTWFRILKELPGSLLHEHMENIKGGTTMIAKNKIYISTVVIFWITFAFFIMYFAGMYTAGIEYLYLSHYIGILIGVPFQAVLSVLGIVLIILAAKAKFTKIAKVFFILTGVLALGMVLSMILGNLVFAHLIKYSENVFSGVISVMNTSFYILATIVCPLALLVGAVGSIVLIAKKKVKI